MVGGDIVDGADGGEGHGILDWGFWIGDFGFWIGDWGLGILSFVPS